MNISDINDAISLATINGNFNSDLIANDELKRLCILTYTNKVASENPDSVLVDYVVSDSVIANELIESSLNDSNHKPVKKFGDNVVLREYKVEYTLSTPNWETESHVKYFKTSEEQDSFIASIIDRNDLVDINMSSTPISDLTSKKV